MVRARVPDEHQTFRSKTAIAIEEVDRLRAAGVRFGCVLADAGYGLSAPFRQALSERGLAWTVGIPRHQKVYPADVTLVFPTATRGRKRLRLWVTHLPHPSNTSTQVPPAPKRTRDTFVEGQSRVQERSAQPLASRCRSLESGAPTPLSQPGLAQGNEKPDPFQ